MFGLPGSCLRAAYVEMIRPGRAISLAAAGLNIVWPGPALLSGHVDALPPRKDGVSTRKDATLTQSR